MASAVLKPMPSNIARHAIGLLLQDLARFAAVFVDQLHALAGRDAVGLEKNVELAEGPLLVPRLLDRGGADFADAGHVAEPARFLRKHAKGLGAEGVHDLVGVDLAHAGHETGPEVFANPIHARGKFAAEALHLELRAVLRVRRPHALEVQGLAALHAGQRANDGHLVLAVVGTELRDRVVVLLVKEHDALEHPGKGVGRSAIGGGVGQGRAAGQFSGPKPRTARAGGQPAPAPRARPRARAARPRRACRSSP